MRILITGASGFIGSHLARALLAAGHDVLAGVRHPADSRRRWPKVAVVTTDFTADHSVTDWIPRLTDIDVVINAVGIIRETGAQTFNALHTRAPAALFQACAEIGVHRVIQISALGANARASSRYHRSKYEADRHLRGLDLDWAVVMPSIVYGPGAKSMALFRALASLPLIPLIGQGDQRMQPIHIDDLTRAVVRLVESLAEIRADIELVGPAPVTLRALYGQFHQWLGPGRARFVAVPDRLALPVARLAGLFGGSPVTAETVRMLQSGSTGDVAPFVSRFGFQPRSLAQVLADNPALPQDRWYAGLYFLRPLLRITIALVWIATGLVSAFVYPVEQSFALLAQAGIHGAWQPLMLYGASVLNLLLGLAVFFRVQLQRAGLLQIALMLLYSAMITAALPEYWAHPFGPVTKNLPLIVATLIMLVLERQD